MKTLFLLRTLVVVFAVIIVVLLGFLFFYNPAKAPTKDMSPAGNGIVSSSSAALVSPDGALTIATSSLRENATIASPLALSGSVTGGGWFFEASFPVKIVDGKGAILGRTVARAGSDWMTTGTVPWSATLVFSVPPSDAGATGTVVFMSDNPSGDPARQKTFNVPVKFQ